MPDILVDCRPMVQGSPYLLYRLTELAEDGRLRANHALRHVGKVEANNSRQHDAKLPCVFRRAICRPLAAQNRVPARGNLRPCELTGPYRALSRKFSSFDRIGKKINDCV